MSNLDHVYAVILAGGGGTRLWPKSRTKTPKQFLKLTGDRTMIQLATDRVVKLVPWERVVVITNHLYQAEVQRQLPQLLASNIISEPAKKDTALAMLVGALYAQSLDPQAIVINSASDHIVKDEKEYLRIMRAAIAEAEAGDNLITVGITPTFPATAFGYIKIGTDLKKLSGGSAVFKVRSFTEKPKEATARAFISTGKYFWNANMYVWSVKSLWSAFSRHFPEISQLTTSLQKLSGPAFHQALPKIYEAAPSISIDYAISEKADNLLLIPGDFGWDDVGNWDVVYALGHQNEQGNVIMGDSDRRLSLTLDSTHNLIHTDSRLIALAGVKDMIIIDTPEIILIAPKSRSQDVKKLVEKLQAEDRTEYL